MSGPKSTAPGRGSVTRASNRPPEPHLLRYRAGHIPKPTAQGTAVAHHLPPSIPPLSTPLAANLEPVSLPRCPRPLLLLPGLNRCSWPGAGSLLQRGRDVSGEGLTNTGMSTGEHCLLLLLFLLPSDFPQNLAVGSQLCSPVLPG